MLLARTPGCRSCQGRSLSEMISDNGVLVVMARMLLPGRPERHGVCRGARVALLSGTPPGRTTHDDGSEGGEHQRAGRRRPGIISREIFVSEEIYRQEQEQVFARAWLFVGHESQIPRPGDFFVSSMGEESVILCRDRGGTDPRLPELLPPPRHEGLPLRRGQHGRVHVPVPRLELRRPTARWSACRSRKDAYGAQLDRSQWGLIEVAQLENYKGTIWATWDPRRRSFLDYLGGYKLYLDLLLDAWDGREGGTEVIGGVHKWLMPCNWKFPAENFSGDRYHGVSHRSVDMVGIGPSGKGRRDMQERNEARWLDVSFPELGHSMIAFLRPHDSPLAPAYQDAPVVADYFRRCEEERKRRRGAEWRLFGGPGTVFPEHVAAGAPAAHASPCGIRAARIRPRCGAGTWSTPTRRPR